MSNRLELLSRGGKLFAVELEQAEILGALSLPEASQACDPMGSSSKSNHHEKTTIVDILRIMPVFQIHLYNMLSSRSTHNATIISTPQVYIRLSYLSNPDFCCPPPVLPVAPRPAAPPIPVEPVSEPMI